MDTSENYIKMCEKADEVQATWQISSWDYCYCEKERESVVLSGYETDGGWYGHGVQDFIFNDEPQIIGRVVEVGGCGGEGRHVWLPRQDQLQEMLNWSLDDSTLGMSDFLYRLEGKATICSQFASWEQLWLAFVMKEKYGKTWDGEEWIKEV